jgi:hypothetical protein
MVYEQENIGKYKFRRVFTENVETDELIWHRDREDRKVYVESGNDWMLQIDNELPQVLQEGQTYFIPKMTYHRVIKGTGDLKIVIDESSNYVRVPKTIKENAKKGVYYSKREGKVNRIALSLVENEYVSKDLLKEIKHILDCQKILSESIKKSDLKKSDFYSLGGKNTYKWVLRHLV